MVGVPGRSKGCITCRKRKIACSLERPICQVCIKSKRECGGYERKRIFVLDQRTQEATASRSEPGLGMEPKGKDKSGSKDEVGMRGDVQVVAVSPQRRFVAPGLTSLASPSTRAAYRQQILSEFLYSYLPSGKPEQAIIHGGRSSWLSMLPGLSSFTPSLEATILAVCTGRLGRINGDLGPVHESLKFYIQGLWELQKAIQNPRMVDREETLAACLSLVIYEVMECPNRSYKAMWEHCKGCARLFELRGPEGYSSEFGHQLFLSFRALETMQALVEKRSTFLSSLEWTNAPWKGYTKSDGHCLQDFMAELSGIIEMGYQRYSQPSSGDVSDIVDQGWKLDAKLDSFWKRVETSAPSPLYWPKVSSGINETYNESDRDPFPVALRFPDISTAYFCICYWAVQCILWSSMGYVYRNCPVVDAEIFSLDPLGMQDPQIKALLETFQIIYERPLGHRADVSKPAKNICQALDYCIENDMGVMGPSSAVFPLKVAIEVLNDDPSCSRELAWAEAAMNKIYDSGVRILGNLGVPMTTHGYIPG